VRGVWYVGIVGMSIRSRRGLRIFYCRIIWFEGRMGNEYWILGAEGRKGKERRCEVIYPEAKCILL
jgi:hypothetical protein